MNKLRIIEKNGRATHVVVPIGLWKRVRHLVDDAEDRAALERFDREDDGTRIPGEVVSAMVRGGHHPVRAWRDHRRMTQATVAQAAGISVPYLSQIEGGKRVGTPRTLARIARVLQVPMDLLVQESSAR